MWGVGVCESQGKNQFLVCFCFYLGATMAGLTPAIHSGISHGNAQGI